MNASPVLRQLSRLSQPVVRHRHAPFRIQHVLPRTQRQPYTTPSSAPLRKRCASTRIAQQVRHESSKTVYRPLTNRDTESHGNAAVSELDATARAEKEAMAARKAQEPAYELTFTCRKCMERSSHRVTKQAYHHGTTLITCPGCKNRHLISDHLKIFSDKGITLEDILKEKGQFLKKGRLGEDGDIEFYDETNNAIGLAQLKASEGKD